jgi:general secretion pathway protein B
MSYILEALKKAQAERQLGNAPTIHAPQPVQAAQPGMAASRRPLFIGLGAGVLVAALGGLVLWQRGAGPAAPAAAPAAPSVSVPAPVPSTLPPPVASRQGLAPSVAAGAASNTLVVSAPPAPEPRPVHVAEAPARPAPAAAGRAGAVAPVRPAAPAAAPVLAATPAAPRAATPVPAPAPVPEDSYPYLHQLPDVVQRDIPRVTFGGYMYSANPADRLLIVDKALRHEGEEVAPGLLLERLLPKAAVMNFRGIRYRVAY